MGLQFYVPRLFEFIYRWDFFHDKCLREQEERHFLLRCFESVPSFPPKKFVNILMARDFSEQEFDISC
jgi:hypothetical protein